MSSYPKEDVRYVPTLAEEVDRIKATTVEQVRTLYRDYLGAAHGEVAVVGDFDPSETLPVLARALEGWKAEKAYARIERPYQPGLPSARETIVTPDKANATYRAGLSLPVGDEHPDYPALVAGNFILGGGSLSSRLGDRLRQKDGLSYGAGSTLMPGPPDARATLTMQAICNPANLPRVVRGVDEELARLLRDGVTPRELEMAQTGHDRQQQVRRSNDAALAGILANNLHLNRTMQHEADLERAIGRLTPDDVNAALRKHLDPMKLAIVGAGDVEAGTVK
jgi:zinc protease